MQATKVFLVIATTLAACASTPDESAYLPAQGAACIEQRSPVLGKDAPIRWCIASQMFSPRKYDVRIAGRPVFTGDDYRRVKFAQSTEFGEVDGKCDEFVVLMSSKTGKPFALADLPPSTVNACKITASQDGLSQQFLKSEECDASFYKDLGPMLGPLMPVEQVRQCSLRLNGGVVFDGKFFMARRF